MFSGRNTIVLRENCGFSVFNQNIFQLGGLLVNYSSYGDDRWKILCGEQSGPEGRALELLYGGISGEVPYILVAEPAAEAKDLNQYSLLLIGTRKTNPLLASLVCETEMPENGYLVQVMDSPFSVRRQIAVLCGSDGAQAIYAVAHFLNDYLPDARQRQDHMPYFRKLFSGKMPEYTAVHTPAFAERGIWTWGHCIYDYRKFARNMARLGLNAVTIWNDYAPVNLKDVVSCFHSYGIKVTFGYSWGWGEPLDIQSPAELNRWRDRAIQVYEQQYSNAGGDGIYFQSFTETNEQEIGGVPIADAVVAWVNTVGGAMLERWPDLKIQFGLHATSVHTRIDALKQVDSRISIIWEDCGAFPYAYLSRQTNGVKETLSFTDRIVSLRPACGCGVVLKGQVCLDWDKFEHQQGPFLLGCQSERTIEKRLAVLRDQWHDVQGYWIENIGLCRRTLERLIGAAVYALVEDALLESGCWYPVALYAQLLWTPHMPDHQLLRIVARRPDVTML